MTIIDLSTEELHLEFAGNDREELFDQLEEALATYADADYRVTKILIHQEPCSDCEVEVFVGNFVVEVEGVGAGAE